MKIIISHNEGDENGDGNGNPNFINANVPYENSFDLASEGNKMDDPISILKSLTNKNSERIIIRHLKII